jgi:hypothetical protein
MLAPLRGDLLVAPFDIFREHKERAAFPYNIHHALIIWARNANDGHDLPAGMVTVGIASLKGVRQSGDRAGN